MDAKRREDDIAFRCGSVSTLRMSKLLQSPDLRERKCHRDRTTFYFFVSFYNQISFVVFVSEEAFFGREG